MLQKAKELDDKCQKSKEIVSLVNSKYPYIMDEANLAIVIKKKSGKNEDSLISEELNFLKE